MTDHGPEVRGVRLLAIDGKPGEFHYYPCRPSLAPAADGEGTQLSWLASTNTLSLTTQLGVPSNTQDVLRQIEGLSDGALRFHEASLSIQLASLELLNAAGDYTAFGEPSETSGMAPFQAIFRARLPGEPGPELTLRATYRGAVKLSEHVEASCVVVGDVSQDVRALVRASTLSVSIFDAKRRIEAALASGRLSATEEGSAGAPEAFRAEARKKATDLAAQTLRDFATDYRDRGVDDEDYRAELHATAETTYTHSERRVTMHPVTCTGEIHARLPVVADGGYPDVTSHPSTTSHP